MTKPTTNPEIVNFGRFTRELAAEAFLHKKHAHEILRDHDELMRLLKDQPGFMDGYLRRAS